MTIYSNFKAQVRRELEESTATVWSDDSLLSWYNEATFDIAAKTRLLVDEIYQNTVAAQRSYELETDPPTLDIVTMFLDGDQLDNEDASSWKKLGDDALTETGTPLYYSAFGTPPAIYLRPIPTEVKQMRVWRHYAPSPLGSVTSASATAFSSRYDRTISDYIKARAFEQVGDWDAADRYNSRYDNGVERIKVDVALTESADAASSEPVERY